ncbi:MAG: amidohydrolase [Woeseiaceae bacterium]|jgi:predicted amidohydrolase YtcJ|nr:amidohydrolase [Woeseiaceae bacterium]
MSFRTLTIFALLCALTACSKATPPGEVADSIYSGGTIITIDDARPLAEAVVVKDGRILAVGALDEVSRFVGESTQSIDLDGKTMLPGFVDSHGHVFAIGSQELSANLLPPPDGPGQDIAALETELADFAATDTGPFAKLGWIVGFGYDDSQLAEQRHPTRDELDAVSTDRPVLIIHQSGHLGVANSLALELAGITAATGNPPGGVIRRRAGSMEPNGVLEETAFFRVIGVLGARFDDEVNRAFVLEGARAAARYGYTTAQEGRASADSVLAMQKVADTDGLPIDVVAYPDVLTTGEVNPTPDYTNRFRVGGVKLTIDGSPQGKTAWLTEPYHVVPDGLPADYRGYPAVDEETTFTAIEKAFANGWQVLVHANGDAAIDSMIAAVRAARDKYPGVDNRPVLIHGQTLRADQVGQLKALDIFPSLFPMHTFYWGDWHRDSVLGPDRAENISPTGWLRAEDMIFGTHHDAPVALPDSMRVLSATVTRRTRSGAVLGPEHRVDVMTALRAMTIWPAWQHFEEDDKGSIEVGKVADFVILSANPLAVPEAELADIDVIETIKGGESVYRLDADN